ncbi:MAG: trigger factor, partial [Proteobacteria bacterium]|nr:trigger factor [Pseudomonadota bacterium]
MEIKETLNKGLKRAYSMTIKHEELETKVEAKLREAQPNVELRGFRKGKVPFALLKKQFGQNIMGEVMQESVDGAMREHMEKSGDRPAAQPEMKMTNENWKEGEDVQISLSYECMPDIPKADFSKVKLERLTVKPEAEDINGALDNLAGSAQDFADKTGAAADGDQVVMDFIGSIDGVAFDGGTGTDYPLVLGSNSFIPGFEAQLIGVKSGDSKTVNVDFPTEYASAELAGKAASFACTIKAVKKPVAAKIDDEFAKKFGAENLADLKGKISDRLKEEYAGAARMVMKRELMDELDKLVDFDLPEGLLESEANQIAHSMWHEE